MAEHRYEDDSQGNPLGAALLLILIIVAVISVVVIIAAFIPKGG